MNYRKFIENTCEQAGDIIADNFLKGTRATSKSDRTLVTAVDEEINKLVIDQVRKVFPSHGVYGEEESYMGESEYTWVCDPIDGTAPFVWGAPTSVFAIALCKQQLPIISGIYAPVTKQLWITEDGVSKCNGQLLSCSKATHGSQENLAIGLATYYTQETPYDLHKLGRLLETELGANLLNFRSTIYMDALVANGALAANIADVKEGWDCIGAHSVEAAGGMATTFTGDKVILPGANNGYISSNGLIHNQILELLKQCRTS